MKEFVIGVKRTWTLLILPILALLYFLAVVVIVVRKMDTGNVTQEMLIWGGLGLFVLVMLIEIPFLLRRNAPRPVTTPEPVLKQLEPDRAPMAPPTMWDDERVLTQEVQQGLTVLEWSAPAKSRHRNAVYTKAYVPVSKEHVLRIETLVADSADL